MRSFVRSSFASLLLATSLIASVGASGCREEADDGPDGAGANGGSGDGAGTNAGGSDGGGNEGGGPIAGCEGPDATIDGITTGQFGAGSKVGLKGVVAMSHKFLASKSQTGNCLWGVFVSAPGLSETGPNTGLLVLGYGFPAEIPKGGDTAFCPRLGQDPAGDAIPDNVKPGDVLDLIGTVQRFPEDPMCTGDNPANQVGQLQLSSLCKAEIVGEATPPTPHVLTTAEIASISSTTDAAFHDQWGGVKVRVEDVGVEAQGGMVLGDFGIIKLDNGIEVGDKVYYRGYSNNECHEAPVFPDASVVFDRVDGFHYLAFCTWGLQANDKCADFAPQSGDCSAPTCQPDFID